MYSSIAMNRLPYRRKRTINNSKLFDLPEQRFLQDQSQSKITNSTICELKKRPAKQKDIISVKFRGLVKRTWVHLCKMNVPQWSLFCIQSP